ncbi:cuticle protein 19.8-like [Copidosoma floridanum]|uniref:cuticle protein 19.8-like n=1 Tax=Copidosoma floridanum TaxID=29053 RepID=UPI0006C9656B|nr:cuticle protein 19.8-like [Copidosoma floridanum]
MFKFVVFLAVAVACVFAAPKPGYLAAAPLVATAPAINAYSAHPYYSAYAGSAYAPLAYAAHPAAAPIAYASPYAYSYYH